MLSGLSFGVWWIRLKPFETPYPNWLTCHSPRWWDLHLPSVLLGIFLGLLIWPLIEALLYLRCLVFRYWLQRLLPPAAPVPGLRARPLFKLHRG